MVIVYTIASSLVVISMCYITLYIRTVISMKMINCNGWSLNNKLKTSMLIEPSVGDLQVYFACSPGRLAWFYNRLGGFGLYGFCGGRLPQ